MTDKKSAIYHISLALNVGHRKGRGLWFCNSVRSQNSVASDYELRV